MTESPDRYRPCAGVALWARGGRVFLGRRKEFSEAPHAWQMPQGGIDAGEDAATAAVRELCEETGIKGHLARLLRVAPEPVRYDLPEGTAPAHWQGRWVGQALTWVHLHFEGHDADVNLDQPHPEFEAWRWATPEEAMAQVVPFKRAAYEAAFSGQRPA